MLQWIILSFQKTSWSWQYQKLYQRVREWLILQFSQQTQSIPEFLPPWWLKFLFWSIIAILIGVVAWQIYRILVAYWPTIKRNDALSQTKTTSLAQNRSVTEWLNAAQNYQQQRNYGEASRALYMAMIGKLRDMHLIRNSDSLTDQEYATKVAQFPEAEQYNTLLQTHEQFKFGNAVISAERFQQCQQAYDAIEQDLNA